MADIAIVDGPSKFSSAAKHLFWDRKTGKPGGAQLPEDSPLRNRPNLFEVNGGPVTINASGTVVRLRINGSMIDVNMAAGDCAIEAKYPPGASMPNSTPLMLDFTSPPSGVGGYISILGDDSLYDGRAIHGVMWILLAGDPQWKLAFGDGITGRKLAKGRVPTTAFVGAEGVNGARITSVCFDASLAGNFDRLVLSELYWTA